MLYFLCASRRNRAPVQQRTTNGHIMAWLNTSFQTRFLDNRYQSPAHLFMDEKVGSKRPVHGTYKARLISWAAWSLRRESRSLCEKSVDKRKLEKRLISFRDCSPTAVTWCRYCRSWDLQMCLKTSCFRSDWLLQAALRSLYAYWEWVLDVFATGSSGREKLLGDNSLTYGQSLWIYYCRCHSASVEVSLSRYHPLIVHHVRCGHHFLYFRHNFIFPQFCFLSRAFIKSTVRKRHW